MSRRPFIPRTQNAGASSTMQESSMMQTRPLLTEPHSPSSGRKLPSSPLPPSPRLAMFPQPHEPSSPTRSADSVARGEWGTAYGPYTYERGHRQNSSTSSQSPFSVMSERRPSHPPAPSQKQRLDLSAFPAYTTDVEEDDALHRPDRVDQPFVLWSARGWLNVGTIFLLMGGLIVLFAGYPVIKHYLDDNTYHGPGFNVGGINASGQIPDLPGMPNLIDKETPKSAWTYAATDGSTYNLVFSDEFNTDGRTFWPGDDPFWEGQDLHYWATGKSLIFHLGSNGILNRSGDYEWYTPDAITTQNGQLVLTLSNTIKNGLNYTSGMLTSWNKFCFTTGYIEVNVSLPGSGAVAGLWPGVWTMGNLGRAGYGATTEGTWPYSYDTCDLGSFPSQMDKQGNPSSSLTDGWQGGQLSNLPGQRLSACTCPGSDHPGPSVGNGRGAPELDILEAQVDRSLANGEVSQSFQVAPFNANVTFDKSSPPTTIYNSDITQFNSFSGTSLQQSVSAVTLVDNANYNNSGYATYGIEYWSDMSKRQDGYITWFSQGQKSWTLTSPSIGPDAVSQVDQRLVPEEPMYIILNLGMAQSFEAQDWDHLVFPSKMYIDYVRVYQRSDVKEGVGCNPSHHPTTNYINNHANAYSNPNFTTWDSAGYSFPRNSKYDGC